MILLIVTVGGSGLISLQNSTTGVNLGVAYGAGSGNITGLVAVNSSMIAGSSSDGKVYFWNTNFVPVYSFTTGHTSTVSCILMPTSSIMITASYDCTAKVIKRLHSQSISKNTIVY